MGWAVVQIVDPYHPEGDTDRPKTNEHILWIFETQQDACRHKADLMIAGRRNWDLIIKSVKDEAWTLANLSKKGKK